MGIKNHFVWDNRTLFLVKCVSDFSSEAVLSIIRIHDPECKLIKFINFSPEAILIVKSSIKPNRMKFVAGVKDYETLGDKLCAI